MNLLDNLLLSGSLIAHTPVKDLILSSASDTSHAKSLVQWLKSVAKHESRTQVFIYDLGLTPEEKDMLKEIHPRTTLRTFDFEKYPAHFNIRIAAGQYAWKPAIIHELVKEFDQPVCWMDAGNLVTQPIVRIRKILSCGFYSPSSRGCIRDWTHPSTLKALNFPNSLLNEKNRNGACIAFNPNIPEAKGLLESWYQAALDKDIIAPEGSNRSNHRQDQALLSALFYLSPLRKKKLLRSKLTQYKFSFKTHQDLE